MFEQLYNAIFIGSIYALFAVGFALVFSVLDILNLAHPTVFILGAFAALFTIATLGLPWWLAVPIAFVAPGFFGILLARTAFAPLRGGGAPPLSAMISSLAVTLAVVRVVELRYGGDFITFPAGTVPSFLIHVGDATLEGIRLAIIALSIALMLVLTYLVRGTALGREIRALAENPRAARILGIDVERAIAATFFISSGLGGLAGVLLAFAYNSLDSRMGLPLLALRGLLALSVWPTLCAGQLTLGTAAFMAIGAYTSALRGRPLGAPFPLALAAGAVAAAALAAPLGLTVFRLRGVYLAIATLAFGEVVRVILLATPITGRGQGLNGIPPKTELWHIYLSLAVVAYVLWRVQGSIAARAWAAIREDEVAAASQGVRVRRCKLGAFVAGALLAAWAGGLSAHLVFSIEPNDFAFTRAVQILVFAVVGGIPNVVGPILGATVFTALPELLRPFKDYRDIFQGAILLAVIIYLPRGIVTLAELRKTRRLAEIGAADVA